MQVFHRRSFLRAAGAGLAASAIFPSMAQSETMVASDAYATTIIKAARDQIGITRFYDPAYTKLDFPGGDVAPEKGVCTDVLIRALRQGAGVDLQLAVNRDMKDHFTRYPKIWGLKRPDRNIDHRRVPNLRVFLTRMGAALPRDEPPQPGDIISVTLPGNLPHIMLVGDRYGPSGNLMVVHNVGRGTQEEDRMTDWPQTGHFRLTPTVLERLRRIGR